jgi:23S rRNA pseudouridine1911/1915/1917 synthase
MNFTPHILFEDNHLLVIEKPIGILSQADYTGDPNLVDLLKEFLKIKYQKPGNVYLGLIHRLDRPVGGVMIFGKTSKASSRLQLQMQLGEIHKYYLAVTEAHPPDEKGKLIHYLSKNEDKNKTRVYDQPNKNTKECILEYEVLANVAGKCLLRIALHTGRSHQIRAQLAHINCPICGDNKYGPHKPQYVKDIALYSYKLCLIHPVSLESHCWTSYPKLTGFWSEMKAFLPK